MKTIRDDNFLNGTLNLCIMEEQKLILGRFVIYDPKSDEIFEFTAKAKCHNDDIFDEALGIKIVKLRIAKKYYSFVRNVSNEAIQHFVKCLNMATRDFEKSSRKIENINNTLLKIHS
jgi:hypothetical protein